MVLFHAARRPGVTELMHNLDYCDVLLIGDELNPDKESLEIHHSALLGKHLDATNSTSGLSIYGRNMSSEQMKHTCRSDRRTVSVASGL